MNSDLEGFIEQLAMIRIFGRLAYLLYRFPIAHFRKIALAICLRFEGGQFYSHTLRRIALDYHGVSVGLYSYGGCFDFGNTPPGTRIGRYCSFAQNVYILNGNHPLHVKSSHPFFYNPALKHVNNLLISRTNLHVGNDVWIGQNVIILPSVTEIGDGAAIGAGAVVSKNVPPFAVVAGNPARIIRYRFSAATITGLLQEAWWDKDIEEIERVRAEFSGFFSPLE